MPRDRVNDTPPLPVAPFAESPAPPVPVQVDVAARSHPGKVRRNNEDCYLVARTSRVRQTLASNLPPGLVPDHHEEAGYGMVVADGLGGMAAGEVASRLAIAALVDLHVRTPDWIMRVDPQQSRRALRRLAQRYREVHAVLRAQVQAAPNLAGMGTTMTLAYSLGAQLFLGHVGDSRAYLLRGDEFQQLTRDHTYAQALADMGAIQPDEVASHQLRHVLIRALSGSPEAVDADVQRLELQDGDQVLLCTDGLTNMVEDHAVQAALQASATSAKACEALVDLALAAGGKDNVTVALARYRFGPEP
jgi:protein phosphatase